MSLCRHDWPGNVRELANLIERMAIMHPYGVIGVHDLPKKYRYDDSEVETFNLARRLRDRIQQLPRRVAPQIVATVVKQPDVREVEALLDTEIHEALSELVR